MSSSEDEALDENDKAVLREMKMGHRRRGVSPVVL